MRRAVLALIVVISLSVPALATDWAPITAAMEASVKRIEMLAPSERDPGICSGVVINVEAGFLLSAAHCVDEKGVDLTVDGRHAEVARANRLLDLAVIRYQPRKGDRALALADKTPPMGSDVAVVGFPFGIEKVAAQFGRISQALNAETRTIWINVDLIFGDSGGPVIDPAGRLVGINSRIYHNGPAHLAAAVPVEVVRDFVEPYLPKGQ